MLSTLLMGTFLHLSKWNKFTYKKKKTTMTGKWKTKISHPFSVKRKIHPVYAHSNYSRCPCRKKRVEVIRFPQLRCVSVRTGRAQLPTSTKAGSFCLREAPLMMGSSVKGGLCTVIHNYYFRRTRVCASDGQLSLVRWRPRFIRLNLSVSLAACNEIFKKCGPG